MGAVIACIYDRHRYHVAFEALRFAKRRVRRDRKAISQSGYGQPGSKLSLAGWEIDHSAKS
jgi:hypothetical protein